MSDENKVVAKQRCPKCELEGKDRHGDNLALYGDGHTHCFACGFHTPPPMAVRVKKLQRDITKELVWNQNAQKSLNYPEDTTSDLPTEPLRWLKSYGLTDWEINEHFVWSPSRELLIFPVCADVIDNEEQTFGRKIVMWQGRNFREDAVPKYLTGGEKSATIAKVGIEENKRNIIILTEDPVSAIKVGRCYQAAPLFGSHVPLEWVRKLADEYDMLGLWLDDDKKVEAVKQALRASQYMPTFVVQSILDPKEYSNEGICQFIEAASLQAAEKEDAAPKVVPFPTPLEGESYVAYQLRLGDLDKAKRPSYDEFMMLRALADATRTVNATKPVGNSVLLSDRHPLSNPWVDDWPVSEDTLDPLAGESYQHWRTRLFAPDTSNAILEYNRRIQTLQNLRYSRQSHRS